MTGWTELRGWIEGNCESAPPPRQLFGDSRSGPLLRLRDALAIHAAEPALAGAPGPMDLAVLLRHALGHAQVGVNSPSVELPRDGRFPDMADLRSVSLSVGAEGSVMRVARRPWRPPWLKHAENVEPGWAATQGLSRRPPEDAPAADPFFSELLGWPTYATPAQKAAVRALVMALPGETVVANLPTGSGKSAVAYVQAAVSASAGPAVAIVVVPTTSLAVDQERAFGELFGDGRKFPCPSELAYHAEMDEEVKAEFRQRVREGRQPVVFTSPESLLQGLRPALFDAADAGFLSLFVVDEVHAAVAWGEEFRPDFQFMAPLRDELLAVQRRSGSSFPTLLLSGTLTDSTLERIARTFGRSSLEVVSGAALRPEPEYWVAPPVAALERDGRVIEALGHLPRPALLYVTQPDEADRWARALRDSGYRRLQVVHGRTPARARREAIDALRGGDGDRGDAATRCDLVIGTSAFGLGVDLRGLRAVVHACLPESLDRYYQEVGRSGRDGLSAVAALLPAHEDFRVAASIARDTIISVDLARERWRSMSAGSHGLPNGLRRVKLGDLPEYLFRKSKLNEDWNLRTLLLLQAVGMLSVRVERPPSREEGETQEAWDLRAEAAYAEFRSTRLIELRVGDFTSKGSWDAVQEQRLSIQERSDRSLAAMKDALAEDADLASLFECEYTIPPDGAASIPGFTTHPVRASGGCPASRERSAAVQPGFYPLPPPPAVREGSSARVTDLFADTDLVFVPIADHRLARTRRALREAIEVLLAEGVGSVVGPPDLLDSMTDTLAVRAVAVENVWGLDEQLDVITIAAILPRDGASEELKAAVRAGPRRLLFVPAEAPDPEWPRHLLRDRQYAIPIESLIGRF